jgi:hypothetical protein
VIRASIGAAASAPLIAGQQGVAGLARDASALTPACLAAIFFSQAAVPS